MSPYFSQLLASTWPWPFWTLPVTWLLLFTASHALHSQSRQASAAQGFLKTAVSSTQAPFARQALLQILFASVVMTLGWTLGTFGTALLAGGLVFAMAWSTSCNLRALLFLRALSRPDAASGSLAFSGAQVLRGQAAEFAAGALYCFVAGLLMAHLSLLGGALILGATGMGYVRKAQDLANSDSAAV